MQTSTLICNKEIVLFKELLKQYDLRYTAFQCKDGYYMTVSYTGTSTENWVNFWNAYKRLTTPITEKKTPRYKQLFRRYTAFMR